MPLSHRAARRATLVVAAAIICLETISSGSRLRIPSGTWAPASAMLAERAVAAAVVLDDGRVLVTGGESTPGGGALASVDSYTSDDVFVPASPMLLARKQHVAVLLKDGRVLAAGGIGPTGAPTAAAELYDPAADRWSPAGDLVDARANAAAVRLEDGRVLVAGGAGANGLLSSIEIFDPVTATFTYAAAMQTARQELAAFELSDGRVAIAGGLSGESALKSVELFDPDTGEVTNGPDLSAPRADFAATKLPDSSVVLIGGSDGANDLASADIYDPVIEAFTLADGSLAVPRRNPLAVLLRYNDHVLVVGGTTQGQPAPGAELYTPWRRLFQPTGAPAEARAAAIAAPMKDDGLLLLAGGRVGANDVARAEMYGFATVKTDKDDYAPNETLTISGAGWEPGETVTLLIREIPEVHDDIVVPVTADESGNIFQNDYVFEPHDFGVRFTLTATGSRSEARTTFTDARQFTADITPTTSVTGNPQLYTLTVNNASALGEVLDCVQITIPAGAGTPGGMTVAATDPGPSSRSWTAPFRVGNVIKTFRLGSALNSIDPGGSVAVTFTTTATAAGSQEWTTAAFGATDCSAEPFAMVEEHVQPAVNVSAGTGDIVIIAHAAPQDPQDFNFTTTGGLTPSTFALDDDGDLSEGGGALSNTQTFTGLAAGIYTVTEMAVPDWDLTPVKCVDPSGGTQIFGPTASIDLSAGETVTCTYTNSRRGSIVVEKQTLPDASPGTFTFTGTASGTLSDNGLISVTSLVPGTYTATESDPGADFDLTSIVCDDGGSATPSTTDLLSRTATFKLDPGETVKCTFTNSRRGTVILKKVTVPAGAPGSFGFSSSLAALNNTLADGGSLTALHVPVGTHTATENVVAGFDLTSIACDDGASAHLSTGDLGTRTATFEVDPNETVTCTFTNTQRAHLIVDKVTNPAGDPTSFNFTATGTGYGSFSLTDAAPPNDQLLAPGTYTITEIVPPAWALTSATCVGGSFGAGGAYTNGAPITLAAGQTVTCTFTDQRVGTIIVEKQTIPAGAPGSFVFTGDAAGAIGHGGQITVANLAPGTYTSTETDPGADFDLTALTCDDGASLTPSTVDLGTRTATFKVDPGETVHCTFTNKQRGTLVVKKQTVPEHAPGLFTFSSPDPDASALNGSINADGTLTAMHVRAGDYSVVESDPTPNFDLTDLVCDDVGTGTPSTGTIGTRTATFHLDPGETVTCTFTNRQRAHLIVDKVTNPSGDATSFNFAATGAGYSNFALADADAPNDQLLVPGTYSIAESVPAGWALTSTICAGGPFGEGGGPYTGGDPIALTAGQTVTCTFTDQRVGTIIVDKQTVPAGAPGSFTFTGTAAGTIGAGGHITVENLIPGTYTAVETDPTPNFDLTGLVCDDGGSPTPSTVDLGTRTATFKVDPGETIHCTFTNTQRAHLIVDKITNPSGDPTSFPFTAGGAGYASFNLADADAPNDQLLVPGDYTITESVPAGWALTSANCVGGSFGAGGAYTSGAALTLTAGQTVTCTFTDQKVGKIILDKQTVPAGAPGSFTFTGTAAGTIGAGDHITVENLIPGTYTAVETDPTPNFDLTGLVCDDGGSLTPSTVNLGTRTATFKLDPGETVHCTFTNTQRAHLIVDKITNPSGDPTSFPFTAGGAGYASFNLADADAPNDQPVAPGTYSVTEIVPPGWSLTSSKCVGGPFGPGGAAYTNGGSIALAAGQTVTCTFTDERVGKIIVEKQTIPAGAPGSFVFTGDAAGAIGDGGQITVANLAPGTYTSTEINPGADFDLTALTCDDGASLTPSTVDLGTRTATFKVDPGETVHCTFTNKQRGTLIVEKHTVPDHAPGLFTFSSPDPDASALNGSIAADATLTAVHVRPGDYSVVESDPAPGFDLTELVCDDVGIGTPSTGTLGTRTANFHLDPGETVKCTFTNTQRAHLIVDKVTAPAGDPTSFNFTATGAGYSSFSLTDVAAPNDQLVAPGTYNIMEMVPMGWALTSTACAGGSFGPGGGPYSNGAPITVAAGETVTCTFTDKKVGKIVVQKQTVPSLAPGSFTFTGTAAGTIGAGGEITVDNLAPGSYSSTETNPAPGFDLTEIACDDGGSLSASTWSLATRTATFQVDPGETVHCTFTNTQRAHLIVDKITNPSGDPTSFPFTATGAGYSSFSLTDASVPNDQLVPPGTYNILEVVPPGWTLTSSACVGGPFGPGGSAYLNGGPITVAAGQTVTCTFTDERVGKIIVEKQTIPAGAPGSFVFTGDAAGAIGDGGQITVANLAPGTYTSTEINPGVDFDLTALTCDDGASLTPSTVDLGTRTATFKVDPGETVHCTFTNKQRGTLIVEKHTVPEHAPGLFTFSSPDPDASALNGSIAAGDSLTAVHVRAGDYSVVESDPAPGFDLTELVCDDVGVGTPSTGVVGTRTATFHLDPGETVKCTFTNTQRAHLIVDKVTHPGGDPTSVTFNTTGAGYSGFSLADADAPNDQLVAPGAYTVAEIVPSGWDLAATCAGGSFGAGAPYANGAPITLAAGDSVTCTFVDTKRAHIVVDKVTNPGGDPTSFTFATTGSGYSGFNLADADTPNDQSLAPGAYTVSEIVPGDWALAATCAGGPFGDGGPYANGDTINLAAGDSVSCVFVDSRRSHLIVDKVTHPGGDLTSFNFSTTGSGYMPFSLTDAATPNDQFLAPGSYTIAESIPPGWTLDATCVGGAFGAGGAYANGAPLALGAGETVTCTFVDTKLAHLIVDKVTNPSGDPTSFTFTAGGAGYSSFNLTDADAPNNQALSPGTYSITETVPPTWGLTATCAGGAFGAGAQYLNGGSIVLAAGETVTCTFNNSKVGTIIVEKQTIPAGAPGSFVFTGDAAGAIGHGGQITVANLAPGTYTSTEISPGVDFDLTALTCDDGASLTPSTVDLGTRTATFKVDPGETVRCTFTNKQRGTLIVKKQTVPEHAPGLFTFSSPDPDASALNGSIPADGTLTAMHVRAGDYSVVESDPAPGFDLTELVCDDVGTGTASTGTVGTRTANFHLDPGETVTCTFTNSRRPRLVVDKVTIPSGDSTSFGFTAGGAGYSSFNLTDAAPPNDQTLVPGTYSVAEAVPAGWDLAATCSGGPFGAGGAYSSGASITLDYGDTVTCTFVDTKRAHLVVDKVTNPSGDPTSFGFAAGGAGYSSFSLADGDPVNDQLLVPGLYTITEATTAGWTLSASCSGGPFGAGGAYTNGATISLGAGQVVICTFTNTKNISTGSLVAAYGFNEGHGSTAHDSSGNNNDGTVSGASWNTSGKFGKALSFDGINDWVTVADDPTLDLGGAMTLEAWVKPSSLTGWRPILYKESPFDPDVPIFEPAMSWALYASDLGAPPSAYAMTTAGPDEWIHALGTSNIALNTWTHIAGTYDGATLKLYVNGVLVRSVPRTGPMFGSLGPLRIGGSSVVTPWGNQFFKGLIDEIRVYNRALTQAEIQSDRLTPVP